VLPQQSSEVIIIRTTSTDKSMQVVHSVPGERGVVYRLGSPIWSLDGRGLFFIANSRILAHWLDTGLTQTITDIPGADAAGIAEDFITTSYLRLSRDGQEIFALLHSLRSSSYSVWRIHWATGSARQVWKGNWWGRSVVRVDPPLPAELDDAAVEALFGSREFPVLAPRFSVDGRFYFFTRYRQGFFGRLWIAGYDVEAHREFTVRTLRRGLLWK